MKETLEPKNELVQCLRLRIMKNRGSNLGVAKRSHLVLHPREVIFIGIDMIFVSSSQWQRFSRAVLCHKLLNRIWGPYIEEAEEGHHCEPVRSCIEISCSIVSVEGKQTADHDTPFDSFVSQLKLKERFELKGIITLLLWGIVLEEVLIWVFIVSDVLSPELVDLSDLLGISLGSLVEIIWVLLLLPPRLPLCSWVAGHVWTESGGRRLSLRHY